jgi:hypothetical protein
MQKSVIVRLDRTIQKQLSVLDSPIKWGNDGFNNTGGPEMFPARQTGRAEGRYRPGGAARSVLSCRFAGLGLSGLSFSCMISLAVSCSPASAKVTAIISLSIFSHRVFIAFSFRVLTS